MGRFLGRKIGGGTGPGTAVARSTTGTEAGQEGMGAGESGGPEEVAETPPSLPLAAERPVEATRRPPTARRETVKVSFELERGLHLRLKLASVRQGETIVGMVSRWVEENTPDAR